MPLINTAVPNLIQGVSQQPDATRFAGQCEEQENALSSVADGLKKRPNTRHVGKLLSSVIDSNSFVHFINRDDNEKYVIIHDGTYLCAYSLIDGSEQPITVNGVEYLSTNSNGKYPISGTYLESTTARASLKALTIADTTYVVNSDVSVARGLTTAPPASNDSLVFIKQGDYEKKYGFDVTLGVTGGLGAEITMESSYRSWDSSFQMSTISIPTGGTGSGFAAGDIINVPLPSSKHTYFKEPVDDPDEPDDYYYSENRVGEIPLVLYTQPTIKVLTVGSEGEVLTAQIENAGRFKYFKTMGSGYGYGFARVGTGNAPFTPLDYNNDSQSAPTNTTTEVYTFPSTNNTETTAGSATTTKTRVVKSGVATGTGAAANADTTTILNDLGDLDGTGTKYTGSDSDFDTFFTADLSKVESNLMILKSVVDATTGEDVVFNYGITAKDGLGGGGIGVVYKEVASITDLPLVAPKGFKVKVSGDAELNQDDYYVEFKTTGNENIGKGAWIECVAPNLSLGYDSTTLPVEIISDGSGFTLRHIKMADRVAGDDNSNPLASFVTQTIDNLFFFKNRLGFLCGENVVMSESGLGVLDTTGQLEFNFGRTTVTTLLDSDPIDVSVASSRVTNLKSAKGFQENLVLFSETGQFVLKGGDVLTPKTVSITPITNFSFEDQVDPLPLGSYIYFPFTRGNFTGMREFTVNATTDNYDSTEVTEHVPAYIPKNIIDMAGTTSEDTIALLSGDEKGSLYIYNYFWNNNQKVLSAWSKFTFTGEIRGIEFIKSTLYAVIVNNGETNLVEMPLESGLTDTAGFVTHLDMRVAKTVTHGDNQITLPYTPADNSVEVYTTDGLKLNATNSGATVTLTQAVNDVDADGNDIDTSVFVGVPYTMKYTFSEQLFKAKAGQGSSPSNAAKLLIRNASIYFDKTAHFKVKVTPKFRDTYENVFTPDVIGSTTIGTLNLDSGFYRFPVLTKAQDTKIEIENDSALPSNFQSAEFESFVHSRSNRYG